MKKILIIEDERAVLSNILKILSMEGYEPFGAFDGLMGLEMASTIIPDLIVCDIMMPQMNGYEVLEKLKKNPATVAIPFIFLTAKTNRPDLRQAMELGADDYITKPFTRKELLMSISARLEKHGNMEKKSGEKLEELRNCITQSFPHEFRSPLNGILGFSEILMEDHLFLKSQEVYEIAREINHSGQRLQRLIENFLLYAELSLKLKEKKEEDKVAFEKILSSKEIIDYSARKKAKDFARQCDLELKIAESYILISEIKLCKIIEELLDNAFKYSSPGDKVLMTTLIEENKFKLIVQDQGRGMKKEQIEAIGPYIQFERKIYEQQGAGLGLTIVQHIAELAAGKMILESEEGSGTKVEVILPV